MANEGKPLTEQQAADYVAAMDAGLPAPKGMEHVVFENTTVNAGYRFATAEERTQGDRYDEERARAEANAARTEKLRKQASAAPAASVADVPARQG